MPVTSLEGTWPASLASGACLQDLSLSCHGHASARNVEVTLGELPVPSPCQLRLVPSVDLQRRVAQLPSSG